MKIFKALKNLKSKKNIADEPIDISKQNLFKDLSRKELEKITVLMHKRVYKKGEIVFKQGYPHVVLYLLAIGEVEIFNEEAQKKTHLNTLKAGDHFGEIGLFVESTRTATAMCLTDSVLYAVSKEIFRRFVNNHPHTGIKLLLSLMHSLIQMAETYPELLLTEEILNCCNNSITLKTEFEQNQNIEIKELGLLSENKKFTVVAINDDCFMKLSKKQLKTFVNSNHKQAAKYMFTICSYLSEKISNLKNEGKTK